MDVVRKIFEGMKTSPLVVSMLTTLVTTLLSIKYSINSYAVINIPSESLLPSYDFIIVGSGSAGTIFSGSIEFQKIENSTIFSFITSFVE